MACLRLGFRMLKRERETKNREKQQFLPVIVLIYGLLYQPTALNTNTNVEFHRPLEQHRADIQFTQDYSYFFMFTLSYISHCGASSGPDYSNRTVWMRKINSTLPMLSVLFSLKITKRLRARPH